MHETSAKYAKDLKKGEARGYVMSFSAGLDLGFLIPKSRRNTNADVGNNNNNTNTDSNNVFTDLGAKADKLREQFDKVFKKNSGTSGSLANTSANNNSSESEEEDDNDGDT